MPSKQENSQKSHIIVGIKAIIRFCSLISLHHHIIKCLKKHNKIEPPWVAEVYVLSFTLFITFGLFLMKYCTVISGFIVFIAVYRLFDIVVKSGRVIFIDSELIPNGDGSYIFLPTRNPERWIILFIINIYEIVLCYAVLYLYWGSDFVGEIKDPITAVYQSILTLTTLGYGDIHPDGTISKVIVITQLIFFILIILLIVPRIFSLLRTERKAK